MQHQLVQIDPASGEVEVLATADDGLHDPASLTFGSGDRTGLYLANFALLSPAPSAGLGAAILAMP